MTGGGAMEPVLEVRNLNTYYTEGRLLFGQKGRRHQVLKDVSFTIGQGEIVGLVGESGSGKTTLARTILGFVNDYEGQIIHHSDRPQMVFQDPFGSLNPSFTIGKILEEPLIIKGGYTAGQRKDEVYEMLRQVGLDESYAERMPNELSGGQRQRVAGVRFGALPHFIFTPSPLGMPPLPSLRGAQNVQKGGNLELEH